MKQDTDERAIVLFPDRTRLLTNLLPSLPTMLTAIPIIKVWASKRWAYRIVALLTGTFLLFWESLYVTLWFRLFFPRPIVVVNDEGIAYNPLMPWFVNSALQIRWQEIAAIFPIEMRKNRWLAIVPKDMEAFIEQQKLIRPRRMPLLIVTAQTETPFLIPEPMISPLTINELLARIQAKFQHEIQSYAIKIGEERKITFKTGQ